MKSLLVAVVALLTYLPVQAQSLAFNIDSAGSPGSVATPVNTVPQVKIDDSYRSLNTEEISSTLFSQLAYPRMAAKAGIVADCKVEFVIYKDAQVGKIKSIGESCDYFADAIKDSIESFQWMPAFEDGIAVDFAVKTEIQFRLK